MPYLDPQSVHNPATGTIAPAAWGDTIRDDLEFLIDPPACSVFNSAAQNIATSSNTTLNANSENYDNNAMHSTVTNNSRITIQTAGRYEFIATIAFAGNTSGNRRDLRFMLNGAQLGTVFRVPPIGNAGLGTPVHGSLTTPVSVSDFVEVQALQDSGGNLDVTLVEFAAFFRTR